MKSPVAKSPLEINSMMVPLAVGSMMADPMRRAVRVFRICMFRSLFLSLSSESETALLSSKLFIFYTIYFC